MRDLLSSEIESVAGGVKQDVYYDMGHTIGGWYAAAVAATSTGIEWVMTGGEML